MNEHDPISFEFDIEIQSDTTLPTDKQQRANLALRLRQLQAIDILSLLNFLGVPNADEIVARLQKEMGAEQGGGNDAALMKKNPQLAAQYKQEMARRAG